MALNRIAAATPTGGGAAGGFFDVGIGAPVEYYAGRCSLDLTVFFFLAALASAARHGPHPNSLGLS